MTTTTRSVLTRWLPAAALGLACLSPAWAGSLVVLLQRSALTNVEDAAGRTQHDAGVVQNSTGTDIGYYVIERRVTNGGTTAYNTAAETITLFFAPAAAGDAPDSVTLQGAHVFSSGDFEGSVSAASLKHHALIGASASATAPKAGTIRLVMNWLGGNAIRVP